jgi:hypothetical protein
MPKDECMLPGHAGDDDAVLIALCTKRRRKKM